MVQGWRMSEWGLPKEKFRRKICSSLGSFMITDSWSFVMFLIEVLDGDFDVIIGCYFEFLIGSSISGDWINTSLGVASVGPCWGIGTNSQRVAVVVYLVPILTVTSPKMQKMQSAFFVLSFLVCIALAYPTSQLSSITTEQLVKMRCSLNVGMQNIKT